MHFTLVRQNWTHALRRELGYPDGTPLASARARGRHGGRPFKMTPAKLRLAKQPWASPKLRSPSFAPSWASPGRPSTDTSRRRARSGQMAKSCWHGVPAD